MDERTSTGSHGNQDFLCVGELGTSPADIKNLGIVRELSGMNAYNRFLLPGLKCDTTRHVTGLESCSRGVPLPL